MMRIVQIAAIMVLCVGALGLLGGCAAPEKHRLLYPPPPETSKLEFLNVFSSQNSFDKTPFQRFMANMLGEISGPELGHPSGIASDRGRGKIYVTDPAARTVYVYDENERIVHRFQKHNIFEQPIGIDTDQDGNVYIVDSAQKIVKIFSHDGIPAGFVKGEGLMTHPAYIEVDDRAGRIYVTDPPKNRIFVFDLAGNFQFSFPKADSDQQLYRPGGVAIDSEGRIFVADRFNFRICVFDSQGEYLYDFGRLGDLAGEFEQPRDLAFDSEGHLYVTDFRKSSVVIFKADGTHLYTMGGKKTTRPDGFVTPSAIHVDEQDRILVTDSFLGRFAVWQYLSQGYLQKNPIEQSDLEYLKSVLMK